ncbi:PucR family transcriptional regulator [Desulfosporosinus sp.]|uniref:PucR family transcriptional regulator n=1 Tax=Desulfosporosinus sp. TaxID=157907 RepID=UPI000E8A798A|nr:PucR family transcriptional regulator [Desulfosporosinus sp.]MBC2727147.1 PucR family transcriptional regulator ligand-binding domain-containing protein [Desulfosporosinus sp.]HBV86271.1 PucR family transcriptional regulator [Desulfosporosinus sp.]
MEITVKSLLRIGPLKTSQVVAGYQMLDNVVKGVTIIEAPDIVNWLSGGELLLTSLYAGPGEGQSYREFIQLLAQKKVSALAVKIRRFVQDIPQEVIDAANEFGLPLIELDGNTRFVDIMYPVMEQLFNSQVVKLKYYKDIQERFTTLALQCEGLEAITRTLEELVGNPVAVYDKNFKCIEATDSRIESFQESQERELRENLNEKFSYYRQKVNYPALGEGLVPQVVVEIRAFGQVKAFLTIAELNSPLEEMDFICLENAATVVTLDWVKRFAVSEVEQRFRNDLIEQILTGAMSSATALERANFMEWDLNRPYRIIVFDLQNLDSHLLENRDQSRMAIQGLKSEITSIISSAIRNHTKDYIIGNKVDTVVVLWPVTENDENLLQKIKNVGKEVQEQIKKRMKKIIIQVGIGDEAICIEDIPRSYKEAQDALTYGSMLHKESSVIGFSELGVFRVLCKFAERNSLEEFLPKSLLKILNYDQENKADMLNTLQVFLECNGNASKAAKELFIHYKTMLYRLERIREVTKLDLEDNKNRLELEMGLKMLHLMNKQWIKKSHS